MSDTELCGPAEALDHKAVFMMNSAMTASCNATVAKHSMTEVSDIQNADVIVVENLKSIPLHVRVTAGLTGGTVLPPATLAADGYGPYIKFKAGIRTKRSAYMTDQFKTLHPAFAVAMENAVALNWSRWKLLDSKEAFFLAHAKNTKGLVP